MGHLPTYTHSPSGPECVMAPAAIHGTVSSGGALFRRFRALSIAQWALFEEAVMYLKILAAMFAIAVMAGCNTMEGAGKDVKSVGQSLENSADKHKP
jgi:entericidin B